MAGRGVEGSGGARAGQGAAVGPRGGVAAGSTVTGPRGNTFNRGAAVGPGGGFGYRSPSQRYNNAASVRNNFNHYNYYSANWYGGHPGAWYAAGWASGAIWRAATWPAVGTWFGYGYGVQPISYDYGSSVVYQDNSVYVNGQDVGTADQYYQQAQDLATADSSTPPSPDDQWMALGVFAVSQSGQSTPFATIQLAVNKSGQLGGNYTDDASGNTVQVHGSVDEKTQRAAWTMGDDTSKVVEAGLYNLTKDEAPALVHEGKDDTEQWLLVRIQQNGQAGQDQGQGQSQGQDQDQGQQDQSS